MTQNHNFHSTQQNLTIGHLHKSLNNKMYRASSPITHNNFQPHHQSSINTIQNQIQNQQIHQYRQEIQTMKQRIKKLQQSEVENQPKRIALQEEVSYLQARLQEARAALKQYEDKQKICQKCLKKIDQPQQFNDCQEIGAFDTVKIEDLEDKLNGQLEIKIGTLQTELEESLKQNEILRKQLENANLQVNQLQHAVKDNKGISDWLEKQLNEVHQRWNKDYRSQLQQIQILQQLNQKNGNIIQKKESEHQLKEQELRCQIQQLRSTLEDYQSKAKQQKAQLRQLKLKQNINKKQQKENIKYYQQVMDYQIRCQEMEGETSKKSQIIQQQTVQIQNYQQQIKNYASEIEAIQRQKQQLQTVIVQKQSQITNKTHQLTIQADQFNSNNQSILDQNQNTIKALEHKLAFQQSHCSEITTLLQEGSLLNTQYINKINQLSQQLQALQKNKVEYETIGLQNNENSRLLLQYQSKVQSLNFEVQQLRQSLILNEREISGMKQQHLSNQKKYQDLLSLENNKNSELTNLVECLQLKVAQLEQQSNEISAIQQLQFQIKQLQLTNEKFSDEIKLHQEKEAQQQTEITSYKEEVERWKNLREQTKQQFEVVRVQNRKLKHQINELKEQVDRMSKSVAEQQKQKSRTIQALKQTHRFELQSMTCSLQQRLQNREQQNQQFSVNLQKQASRYDEKIRILTQQKNRLSQKLAEVEMKLQKDSKQTKEAEQQIQTDRLKIESYERKLQKEATIFRQLEQALVNKQKEIKTVNETKFKLQDKIFSVQSNLKGKERQIVRLTTQIRSLQCQLSTTSEELIATVSRRDEDGRLAKQISLKNQQINNLLDVNKQYQQQITKKDEQIYDLSRSAKCYEEKIRKIERQCREKREEYSKLLGEYEATIEDSERLNKQNKSLKEKVKTTKESLESVESELARNESISKCNIEKLAKNYEAELASKQQMLNTFTSIKKEAESKRKELYQEITDIMNQLHSYSYLGSSQNENFDLNQPNQKFKYSCCEEEISFLESHTYHLKLLMMNKEAGNKAADHYLKQQYQQIYKKYQKYKEAYVSCKTKLQKQNAYLRNDHKFTEGIIVNCRKIVDGDFGTKFRKFESQ